VTVAVWPETAASLPHLHTPTPAQLPYQEQQQQTRVSRPPDRPEAAAAAAALQLLQQYVLVSIDNFLHAPFLRRRNVFL